MKEFPKSVLLQHMVVLGKTGSGKSYAVRGIIEDLLDESARVCIIDPTGAWNGLRSSATGKSGGYPVVIFGGAHADLPLSAQHGEAIAETIGTSSTPAIIDTSLMRVGERTRFAAEFADALVRKNKGPLHLVIDEAHLFAPQGKVNSPQAGEMLSAFNNLVSLGRSRGLRIILITQRPAKLHKDSLTQCETLIALRLIAPQDRSAVREWIDDNADKAKGQEIISSLATLKTGHGWIWAPELGILDSISFPKIRTFDSGRAPDGSEGKGQVLAPIDIEAINQKLKAVKADALANDPAELKRRIAELEREARKSQPPAPPADPAAERRAYDKGWAAGQKAITDQVNQQVDVFGKSVQAWFTAYPSSVLEFSTSPPRPTPAPTVQPRAPTRATPGPARVVTNANTGDISPVSRRILDALAELEQMGAARPERELLAFMAGYSHVNSKGFANALGSLRSQGLIEGTWLTDAGRQLANPPARPRTPEEMQDRIINMLGGASARVLRPLIDAYPKPLERQALAEAAGYGHVNSKGFANAMGRFRTLGFIDYPDRGHVVAKPLLFLE